MSFLKYKVYVVILLGSILSIFSCTSADEYLKFTEGGAISYTGKIDSLKFFPGRNRVKVEGLIISDPKVNQMRVYWNAKKDSIVVPINRSSGIDEVSIFLENLPENIYNFEVKTFDAKGNSSISQNVNAQTYGERYQNSIVNRVVANNVLINSELVVNFVALSSDSGALGSEIIYTNTADEEKTVFADIENLSFVINDFKSGTSYKYRSLYKPEENAVDTFFTAYNEERPVPTPVLMNAKVPFIASSTDGGRWGILANWNSNAAVKNHNGYGGWDEWNGNIFNVESGWGSPAITNGKIYQTVTAEPALYQLKVKLRDTNHEIGDVGGAYFVIAKGDGLPNIENLTTAAEVLGYKRILGTSGLDYVIEFTVTTTSQISVGQLTTQAGSTPGRFCNIISFELVVVK
ncbi:DUF4998 domain-containing protein [Flavobacterium sp. FBOR7N2.3]|uniref:DUF4998 domain-containing protein n=1 Tax=Flavobacterium magnesitis TaxID=3138077 RepID=A0ABV4THA0_9FLAO